MKYFLIRLIRGMVSVFVAMCIIILLLFFVLDKNLIFSEDEQYIKLSNNQKITYMYTMWEKYGYLKRVTYPEYLTRLVSEGKMDEEYRKTIATIGRTPEKDSEDIAKWVTEFTQLYESQGYTVQRLDAVMANSKRIAAGGEPSLFAYRNTPVLPRVVNFV